MPLLLQIIGTLVSVGSVGWIFAWLLFIIWLLWFNLFFPPILIHDQDQSYCCGIMNGNCLDVFCSCIVKKQSDKKTMNETQRFVGFKFFIIIGIIGMCTVLAFIQQSNGNLSGGVKGLAIFGIIIMCKYTRYCINRLSLEKNLVL